MQIIPKSVEKPRNVAVSIQLVIGNLFPREFYEQNW